MPAGNQRARPVRPAVIDRSHNRQEAVTGTTALAPSPILLTTRLRQGPRLADLMDRMAAQCPDSGF
ncbi:hypothetical protein GCM10010319_23350 [Streptomyces blastmyceticus]|uniref:Uncharacterized protein n=1 Tax=Streptomyces blastmyceticus TaxID=68180 RepID=A0ABN0WTG0_9ACTN